MRTGTLVVVLAAIGVGGCRERGATRSEADAGPPSVVAGPKTHVLPAPAPAATSTAPAALPMPQPRKLTLLEPGAPPHQPLRYRFGGGDRELVATATITAKTYADGKWTEPIRMAPIRDGFGIAAKPAPGGGEIQLRGIVGDVDASGASTAATDAATRYLARWRGLLERRRANVSVDARGQWRSARMVDDPTGRAGQEAHDELAQRWLGIAVPVPEEPVGLGARWRAVTLLRTGGAVLKQTATYTLQERSDERWILAVDIERIGELQDVALPGLPTGTRAELIGLRRTVTGTLTMGPDDPLPLAGQLAVDSASHARFTESNGQAHDQVAEDLASVALSTSD